MILAPKPATMSDLLVEIMVEKVQKKSLEDVTVCHHVSLPEIERSQYEIAKLKLGQAAMADEVARFRKELAKEKAAKTAILASWKYAMMRLKA